MEKYLFYELGSDKEVITKRIISVNMLSQPTNCPDHLFDLMKKCWQLSPASRPSFKQLFDQLDSHTQSSSSPPPVQKQPGSTIGYYTNNANSWVSNLPME